MITLIVGEPEGGVHRRELDYDLKGERYVRIARLIPGTAYGTVQLREPDNYL
jgi:hypothetical protein